MEFTPRNEYVAPTEGVEPDILTDTAVAVEVAMGADAQSERGHLIAAAFAASSEIARNDEAGDASRGRAVVEAFLAQRAA